MEVNAEVHWTSICMLLGDAAYDCGLRTEQIREHRRPESGRKEYDDGSLLPLSRS